MPAMLLSGIIQGLESRLPGLPSVWGDEGRRLQIGKANTVSDIRVRLRIEPHGGYVVDLL